MGILGLCLKKRKDFPEYSSLPRETKQCTAERGLSMYSDTSSTTGSSESSDAFPGAQQIALAHYGSQKNMWSGKVERTKAHNSYKGQLKVSIYVNYGLLTAHVVSGRHLKSKTSGTCNSYVKVCLMPDEEKRTRCKTDISPESNNPLYDEKFSFELLDEDADKRLFISVWNKEEGRKQCEFLGCMSFGVRHISQGGKEVGGWYYLLPGDVGKRKHLRVSEKQTNGLMERGNGAGQVKPKQQTKPAKDLFWMDTHLITVKRSSRGYGFTISGACPVQVCRVEVGSYAQRVGLRGGDHIMKIDGVIVTRSNADTVARIIRNSSNQVILEIQRQRSLEPISLDTLESSPRRPICSSTPDRFDSRMDVEGYQVSPWRRHRHQPYPGAMSRTPPRSPSLKSLRQYNRATGSAGDNIIPGYPYPSPFETQDYGWIDGDKNADSHGFKVPTLSMAEMAGYGAMDSSATSNTLPRSMKFGQQQASVQRFPSEASNIQTKDYGWLDSKENISQDTDNGTHRTGPFLAQSQSTGTLPGMRKKVSFKDF